MEAFSTFFHVLCEFVMLRQGRNQFDSIPIDLKKCHGNLQVFDFFPLPDGQTQMFKNPDGLFQVFNDDADVI
jgi:hypothetical protein